MQRDIVNKNKRKQKRGKGGERVRRGEKDDRGRGESQERREDKHENVLANLDKIPLILQLIDLSIGDSQ